MRIKVLSSPTSRPAWLPGRIRSLAVVLLFCSGCGTSPSEDSGQSAIQNSLTARGYLQSVFQRYRHAQSYRDNAVARLSYTIDGRLQSEQAPLSVRMDGRTIYVSAYDVQIWSDQEGTMAWIVDQATENHDSQVLRLPPREGRFDPQDLLADAVLNEKISSGLAGPPAQLDWLFADHPMQRLFAENHEIKFGKRRELDDRLCQMVLVTADADQYRFWIDQDSSVIRRVDLPSIAMPDDLADHVYLTLDLINATFDTDTETPPIDDLPRQPKFVSRMIPLPPPQPAPRLGQSAKSFRIRDRTGKVQISDQGSDREITVILFVTATEVSLWNAAAFDGWASLMTADVAARVRSIIIADQEAAGKLPADLTVPVAVDANHSLQTVVMNADRDADCGLVVIDRQGRIAWVESLMTPQHFAALGPIIGDVLRGIDVPGRLLDQWRADVSTYRNLLGAEMAKHQAAWKQQ